MKPATLASMVIDFSGSISHEDMEKFREEFRKLMQDTQDLNQFPWIKDIQHLHRINKYRKRVKQRIIRFNEADSAELALTDRSKWRD